MAKVYYGGYGHNPNPNGKKYAYIGSDRYKVGENVVAPVTHYKSGKNFKTMFTIQDQADMTSQQANDTIIQLENMRKTMKSLDGTNVMELPGASKYPSAEAWKEASKDIQEGKYIAAERLQTKQAENPVKATAEELLERNAKQQQINFYRQHEKYLQQMERYRQQQDKQNELQYFARQDFQFFKRSDFDFFDRNDFDMVHKEQIRREAEKDALTQRHEDYVEKIRKQRQTLRDRLLNRRI